MESQTSEKKKAYLALILKHIDFTKPFKSGSVATTYKVSLPKKGFFGTKHEEVIIKIVRSNLEDEIKGLKSYLKDKDAV